MHRNTAIHLVLSLAVATLSGCAAAAPIPAPVAPSDVATAAGSGAPAAAPLPDSPASHLQAAIAARAAALAATVPQGQPQIKVPVHFHIKVPAEAARQLQYVSTHTASIKITATGPNSATTSVAQDVTYSSGDLDMVIDAPLGADTFVVETYSLAGETGALLAKGTVSRTIVEGTSNPIAVALSGEVASLVLSVVDSTPAIGISSTRNITCTAYDAGGELIVGNFNTPVSLFVSNPVDFALVVDTLTFAGGGTGLEYGGNATTPVTISASVPSGGGLVLTPRVEALHVVMDQSQPALLTGATLPISATVTYSDGTTDHAVSWGVSQIDTDPVPTLSGNSITGTGVGNSQLTAIAGPTDVGVTAFTNAFVRDFELPVGHTGRLEIGNAIAVTSTPTAPSGSLPLTSSWSVSAESPQTGQFAAAGDANTTFTAADPSGPGQYTDLGGAGHYVLTQTITDQGGYSVSQDMSFDVGAHLNLALSPFQLLGTDQPQTFTIDPNLYGTSGVSTIADPAVNGVSAVGVNNPGVATAAINGSGLVTVTPVAAGLAILTITTADGRQYHVSFSVTTTSFTIQ